VNSGKLRASYAAIIDMLNQFGSEKLFNAKAIRERIFQIKITVDALQKEHEAAVTELAANRFPLVPVVTAIDKTDWRNWKEGNLVECVKKSAGLSVIKLGRIYKIGMLVDTPSIKYDEGDAVTKCIPEGCFKFVSRQ